MDFNAYVQEDRYPRPDQFTTVYYYKQGKVLAILEKGDPKFKEKFDELQNQYTSFTSEEVFDRVKFAEARKEWNVVRSKLEEKFMVDMFEEFNVPRDAVTEKMYAMAYEEGHSSGFEEVYNCFTGYVDLYRLMKKTFNIA